MTLSGPPSSARRSSRDSGGATLGGQNNACVRNLNAAVNRGKTRPMAPPLLQLKDIALTFGGTPLLTGAEVSVSTGERVSLVGRNGVGKSTLLKIAARLVEPDRGTVFVQPGMLVGYLPQEPEFSGFSSTLAYVEA